MADTAGSHPGAGLEDLLEMLGSAQEGGLKSDTLLAYAIAGADLRTETLRDVLIEESFSWNVAGKLLDDRPPAFTRTLDAGVPGENIVLATYSEKRDQWAAVQREADGREFMSWAATEALARRAAALQAFTERMAAPVEEVLVPVANLVGEKLAMELEAVEPEPLDPKAEIPKKEEPAMEKIMRDARSAAREWRIKF